MIGIPDLHRFAHEAMATGFEILITGHPHEYARQAAAAAFRELERLESELSRFVESSDIARINQLAEGESVTLGEDALRCLLIAAEVSASTDRAFDPAFRTPGAFEPGQLLYAIDPASHTLTSLVPRLQLDLGAVGKGYALDVMAELLREWDITHACLQSGGSTALAMDPPPGHGGWPIGVGDPSPDRKPLDLAHTALSGSGTAVQGAHLIDPRTRLPASRQGRIWALAPTAAAADALSTAFFVMTDAEIEAYCETHPGVRCLAA